MPRTLLSGCCGRTRSRTGSCCPTAAEAAHRLRIVPHDDLSGAGRVLASRYEVGCLALARNTSYDADAVTVRDCELPPTGRLVVGRPAHGHVGGGAPRGGAGLRPVAVCRGAAARSRRRTGRPYRRCWCGTATRRWTGRHPASSTPTAPTRPSTNRSGMPRCRASSTAASSGCTHWSAAAARAVGAGGSTAAWRHKQHTFDDLIAVADGLDRRLVDGTRIATPGPQRRRAAAGCGVHASDPTVGEPSWRRCRSSTSSPRCSTRTPR